MRLLQSLSFRLALTYVGLFCTSVALLLGINYWISVIDPLNSVKAQVNRETRAMGQIYILDGKEALKGALESRAALSSPHKAFHTFLDEKGEVVTSNLPSWPKRGSSGWVEIEADIYHDGDETDHHAISRDRTFRDGARLIVGRDAEDIADRREALQESAAWILGGTIVLGIVGGIFMSLAIRARIDGVNQAALKIMEGDLSGRIPVRGSGDDFDRLCETLNRMLARIEELFEAIHRVSDSVAHELRTPLTRLLMQLQRADAMIGDPAKQRELSQAAIAEAQRLQRIFDALLRIARIESGRHEPHMRPIDLSTLLEDVADFYAPDAEQQGIDFNLAIEGGLAVAGDPDLLFQAFSNLIDNAMKYTPSGGAVRLSAGRRDGVLLISVCDTGPGLASDDLDHITERFYRGATSENHEGLGLGLSLVAAIAARHNASLHFVASEPGLCVEMTLPSDAAT